MNKKLVLLGIFLLTGLMLSSCVAGSGHGYGYGYGRYGYDYSFAYSSGYYSYPHSDGYHNYSSGYPNYKFPNNSYGKGGYHPGLGHGPRYVR